MSFAECVVIPVDTYRRNCIAKGTAGTILSQNIPSDLKMKLFDQEKQLGAAHNGMDDRLSWVVDQFRLTEKPLVRQILVNYIDKNRHIVSYDQESLQLLIDGNIVPNSNFVKCLQWLLGAETDYSGPSPNGADLLKVKLLGLGVPATWLRSEVSPVRTDREQVIFNTNQQPSVTDVGKEINAFASEKYVDPIPHKQYPPGADDQAAAVMQSGRDKTAAITDTEKSGTGMPGEQPTPPSVKTLEPQVLSETNRPVSRGRDRRLSAKAAGTHQRLGDSTPANRRLTGRRSRTLNYSYKYPGETWVLDKRDRDNEQTGAGYWVF